MTLVLRVAAALLLVGVLLFGASATFAKEAPPSIVLFGVGSLVYALFNFSLLVRPPRSVSPSVIRWAAALSGAGLVLLVLIPALRDVSNAWDQTAVVAAIVIAAVTWLGIGLERCAGGSRSSR